MLQPSGTNDGKGATLKMPERHVQALQVGDHGDGSSIRYVHAEEESGKAGACGTVTASFTRSKPIIPPPFAPAAHQKR